ncbi:Checkpoint 9-1-1 complex, HUS1 component [Ceraceosorus bombacis]|uniref:Checkpoint protein n=1 Tax=Ceraceosorus bombacis TaxID=401625 RepID=A0A0P1BLU5_9BASI|nr:Checkpoint 9-1-1 complex, HUS1 component [Ceraceosorus bombacis]
MRLRVSLTDSKTLHGMIQSVGKIANKCIIRFSQSTFDIIVTGSDAPEGVQIWSQVMTNALFKPDVLRIESNFNDQINLEVATETFLHALKSSINAVDVIIRLAKRDRDPLLNFTIGNSTVNGARLEISQEVLIRVLRPAEISRIREPECPVPDACIYLPRLHKIRRVAERMQSLSDTITVSANRAHELKLSIEKDEVKIETTWRDLDHPDLEIMTQARHGRAESEYRSVRLDMKSFMRFLSSSVVETKSITSICENHCAIFYVYIGEEDSGSGVMTFFLPAVEV